MGKKEVKLSLFMGGMTLCLWNPKESTKNKVLKLINSANYRIQNHTKINCVSICKKQCKKEVKKIILFMIASTRVK